MDFSSTECLLTTAMGKSTSASRLHSFGIISSFVFFPLQTDVLLLYVVARTLI